MNMSLTDTVHFKNVRKKYGIFLAVIAALCALLQIPYIYTVSDVMWRAGVIPLLLEILMQLCHYLFYWISFGVGIYVFLRFPVAKASLFLAYYAVGSLACILAGFLPSCFILGFPRWESFVTFYLGEQLFTLAMDAAQMALVCLLIYLCVRSCRSRLSPIATAKGESSVYGACYPLNTLFDRHKPIDLLCLGAAAIPSVITLLSRLYYDVFFWGAPADVSELFLMIAYYFSDVAMAIVGYFVITLLQNHLHLSLLEVKQELEN